MTSPEQRSREGGKRKTKSTLVTQTERAPADPLKFIQFKVSARDVRGPTEELADSFNGTAKARLELMAIPFSGLVEINSETLLSDRVRPVRQL